MSTRATTTMTRHSSQAPLRRSSVPSKILSAGLATATCIGVVGVLGVRTIDANAADDTESTGAPVPEAAPSVPAPQNEVATTAVVAASSQGLTQADLDAYAAELAAEKERLDAYRAKLVKTAKKLKRQAAALAGSQGGAPAVTWSAPVSTGTSSSSSGSSSKKTTAGKPAAKKSSGSPAQSAPQPAAQAPAQPAPQQPAAQPAPQPKAAPAQQQAPAPASGGGGGGGAQTTTKTS